ncbi:MAG TPA: serine/threonine protein kinase, partial [Pirellulales bacterium]|nr:serine/threonine protein kinase [Pirellulales bacterium]
MKLPLDNDVRGRSSSNDHVLAELADELAAGLQSGRPFDVEAFLDQHAEHAQELRALLPSLELFALLGSAAAASEDAGEALRGGDEQLRGVLGDYRLVREIGRGGMGVVYEAVHDTISRRVALKVLPFAGALDARQLARFKNEAMAAAQLEHPHIVDVHG